VCSYKRCRIHDELHETLSHKCHLGIVQRRWKARIFVRILVKLFVFIYSMIMFCVYIRHKLNTSHFHTYFLSQFLHLTNLPNIIINTRKLRSGVDWWSFEHKFQIVTSEYYWFPRFSLVANDDSNICAQVLIGGQKCVKSEVNRICQKLNCITALNNNYKNGR